MTKQCPWGFVTWANTKVQVSGCFPNDTVQSVDACGEYIETLEDFTYFGDVV